MCKIQKNISLLPYNTFGIYAKADYLLEYSSIDDLLEGLENEIVKNNKVLAVGEGSNLLFVNDFKGVILHSKIKSINVFYENDECAWIEAGSGVLWNDFVKFCVSEKYYGAENLSLIPGQVGAAAVQNIGAYGVEIKDIVDRVCAVNVASGKIRVFTNEECNYDYRDSVFKNSKKDKYIVTSVVFKLSKKERYCFDYKHLKEETEKYGQVSLTNVRQAIVNIRTQKLPDTDVLGNAGSFFKNPYCCIEHFNYLQKKFPNISFYAVNEEVVKLSAAWLIEQSGCKGKQIGNAAIYEKQPLVIVNQGNATAIDIVKLAENVQQTVFEKFAVKLEREVNYIL